LRNTKDGDEQMILLFIQGWDPRNGEISLVIRHLGPGDEGNYTCTVSNPYGRVTTTLRIEPDMRGRRAISPEAARRRINLQLA